MISTVYLLLSRLLEHGDSFTCVTEPLQHRSTHCSIHGLLASSNIVRGTRTHFPTSFTASASSRCPAAASGFLLSASPQRSKQRIQTPPPSPLTPRPLPDLIPFLPSLHFSRVKSLPFQHIESPTHSRPWRTTSRMTRISSQTCEYTHIPPRDWSRLLWRALSADITDCK